MRPSGEPPYWQPGDIVNWRYRRPTRFGRQPEWVVPVTVVRDDAAGLVAWVAPETPMWTVSRADGRALRDVELARRFDGERVQTSGAWQGPGILRVAPTGAPWSIWYFRDLHGQHRGWYINLERPHQRDALNVYTEDYILDLWVTPDRKVTLKDEDELTEATRAGRFTKAEADRIRQLALQAKTVVDDWQSPFNDGWEAWQPDASWPLPEHPTL